MLWEVTRKQSWFAMLILMPMRWRKQDRLYSSRNEPKWLKMLLLSTRKTLLLNIGRIATLRRSLFISLNLFQWTPNKCRNNLTATVMDKADNKILTMVSLHSLKNYDYLKKPMSILKPCLSLWKKKRRGGSSANRGPLKSLKRHRCAFSWTDNSKSITSSR